MTDVEPVDGFHRHHRQKDRSDNRPVNVLIVGPHLHEWIERNPEKARELGWWVDSWQNPEDVPVVIPDKLPTEKKERKPRAKEKPRNRRTISHAVPKDELEDGAGIYDDLLKEVKKQLDLSTGGKSGDYNALVAVMYFYLTHGEG